jgi:NADH:ubiquinone oxidoreductase subunit E/CheY-like chemotaxis protein
VGLKEEKGMLGKILIVDDEPVVVKSCERILSPEGYAVDTASNGREAIGKLGKDGFDLVITDLKMPDMDGLELIRWIRNSKPDAGIVVITGYPSQDSIKEALSLRILDYLPKPFSPSLLLEVTQRAMEFKKSGEAAEVPPAEEFEEKAKHLDSIIRKYRKKPGSLIPVLQEAQELVGYLPPSIQRHIAKGLKIPVSEVHGVVSFYSFFTMKPKGKHNVRVCLGTACYVKGAEEIVKKLSDGLAISVGGITTDKRFSLETVRCLGACGLAPVVVVDKDVHGSVSAVKVHEVLTQYE